MKDNEREEISIAEKTPLISIIVPVWNVEKYLARCLDSVFAQTFKNFEIICVNDGSPDNSAEILEEYSKKDSRIRIINQENQGLSAARNSGMRKAKGKYIYFLDSDDFIHPQLLEITYYFITKYNADWITFRHDSVLHRVVKKAGNAVEFTYVPPLYKSIEDIRYKITNAPLYLFKKNPFYKMTYYAWARLYKQEILKDVEFIPGIAFEDDPFIIAICKKHPKTVLLNEALYFYIDNPKSISRSSITQKQIEDYHKGIVYMWQQYKDAPKKDFDFVAKHVAAKRLRIQYNKIKKSDKQKQSELFNIFKEELIDLKNKNFLRFSLNPRKLFYWLKYNKLVKSGNANV
ncbi:glycosyltransferase family 2 protein [Endomicrobium proavitum]|uniref:Putative Glycosyl transferase, family 2 n=1 Tax=Endomicrobium proavitum TaxID=1408281 RepID=A0A0G3WJP8_9BACT|nr:glycosyltransferase family 2 protein [Endomicrobium proavitum]AKL98105.1 putative Glycosyl transferase, family 2 [Endomicrobium proavitum]